MSYYLTNLRLLDLFQCLTIQYTSPPFELEHRGSPNMAKPVRLALTINLSGFLTSETAQQQRPSVHGNRVRSPTVKGNIGTKTTLSGSKNAWR